MQIREGEPGFGTHSPRWRQSRGRSWSSTAAMAPWVFDSGGKRYLDATAGSGTATSATDAGARARRPAPDGTPGRVPNLRRPRERPALELADARMRASALGGQSTAFFVSGGSDAVDSAAKIARRYSVVAGEPQRKLIIARDGGYHGMNAYGTSLAGIESNAEREGTADRRGRARPIRQPRGARQPARSARP